MRVAGIAQTYPELCTFATTFITGKITASSRRDGVKETDRFCNAKKTPIDCSIGAVAYDLVLDAQQLRRVIGLLAVVEWRALVDRIDMRRRTTVPTGEWNTRNNCDIGLQGHS